MKHFASESHFFDVVNMCNQIVQNVVVQKGAFCLKLYNSMCVWVLKTLNSSNVLPAASKRATHSELHADNVSPSFVALLGNMK